jgi:hypothetical protein
MRSRRSITGNTVALILAAVLIAPGLSVLSAGTGNKSVSSSISIIWQGGRPSGRISVSDGNLEALSAFSGKVAAGKAGDFRFSSDGPCRLDLRIRGTATEYGRGRTVVTVGVEGRAFSVFLRDVRSEFPVYIPAYGTVVTTSEDRRSFAEIARAIGEAGGSTKIQRIEREPEESFEAAAAGTRQMSCPTWLGLSRDMRIFEVGERLESIQPRFHGIEVPLPEAGDKPVRYSFLMGRGWGVVDRIFRGLDEGTLPILRGKLEDDDVTYDLTAFSTLESKPLTPRNVRGTHFLVADGHGIGHMFTPGQQALYDSLLPGEMSADEETVLSLRLVASNNAAVPRYAFLRTVTPNLESDVWSFDGSRGFGVYRSGRVFSVSTLNGAPLAADEISILLRPGETAVLDVSLPHRPISVERASALAAASFPDRQAEARKYWEDKLAAGARIRLPEKRITEMVGAGLNHLDLVTYGLEPDGTLVPTIGIYTAIGSESSPIIQFMDSMGRHNEARRALMFFLDKQHDDGFIQNFGDYMLETGAALWSMGEHYRYTRDLEWVRAIEPKLVKACDYLMEWRRRNFREALRGRGYGLLDGKTADPEDPYRSFMLNGYAYLGMSRVAEMLAGVDPARSRTLRTEAEALKRDIRAALAEGLAKSPVIPLGDGTWCPTVAPWVESRGALILHTDGGRWFTHGTVPGRDSLLGPLYLVFQEVLDPRDPVSGFLLSFHGELMTKRNVAFSQPYYSRHPDIHLRRGEVKPFLKAYYSTVAALADRETYTFWEHFFHASPHKTHEEGWFLMQTRWMLYMERGDSLDLLAGAPRAWLEGGKTIDIRGAASYFGPVSLEVVSAPGANTISASVGCPVDRGLKRIRLRLPHPDGLKATSAQGGTYDPATETVLIEPFQGRAEVSLSFAPSAASVPAGGKTTSGT